MCGQEYLLNLTNDEKETPLSIAAELNFYDGAQILLKFKPNCAIQNKNGDTCLHLAVANSLARIYRSITEYCPQSVVDMENNGKKSEIFIFNMCIPDISKYVFATIQNKICIL